MSKRFFSIVMCLLICLAIGTIGTALAEETEIREVKGETIYVQSRISEEQAEREYLNGLFGLPVTPVEELPRLRGTVSGSRFEEGSQEQKLYTALKSRIQQVAEGTLTSTEFEFTTDEIDAMVFTRANTNLSEDESMFDADGNVSEAMEREIGSNVMQLVSSVISAASFDCPYEAYWRDSGSGCYGAGWAYSYSVSQERVTVPIIWISVRVAEDYRAATTDAYAVNTALIGSAKTAAANARAIVSQNAGKSDYAKLTAYKRKICELTDYNHDAATGDYLHDYGNPWQLVWVFDGNPNTKVVCEGYSKAFQYLCDQSTWNSNIEVISVAGLMWEKTETETSISWSPGAHMWNMVRMNGQNYLADVTNSDDESLGQFGGLFLDGYDRTATASDGSTIYFYETEGKTTDEYYWLPGEAGYSYNGNTTAAFEADRLGPANTAVEPESYVCVDKTNAMIGESVTVTASLPGAGHIRVKSQKGYFVYDYEIQEGDTGEWTVSFDMPGEYTLSVEGWSDEQWNNPEIPNVSEVPNMWGNSSAAATVTVSYAVLPDAIIPGEDVTITLPQMEGAARYEICVETSGIAYNVNSAQCGDFVIPAMVFADGGGYTINIYVYRASEDPEAEWPFEEMYWEYHNRDAEAYTTGAQTLTITAGIFTNGQLPINLNVTNADQVIVQEKDIAYWERPYEYWSTVNVTDNPGATVNIEPLAKREHQIRAAVKKNGVWSAWSNTLEVITPISGKGTETIEWTLSESGKLTISGTGKIPYEMDDPLDDYRDEITEIEIGEGITGIDNNTFAGYENLTTVTVPTSLTTIGECAFCDCERLTSISNPGAEITTRKRCYDYSLKTFSLPSTMTEIGYYAFGNTPAFGQTEALNPDFEIPEATAVIEEYAFFGIDATHVQMRTYGLSRCTIGDYAFGNCTSMKVFQMDGWDQEQEIQIADHAFDGCGTDLIFLGEDGNNTLRQYAEEHGYLYLTDEIITGNG